MEINFEIFALECFFRCMASIMVSDPDPVLEFSGSWSVFQISLDPDPVSAPGSS